MIFEHSIFKEKPPNNSIRPLHYSAVTTRQSYLSWCKARALAILSSGDTRAAIASMLNDISQWEGDQLYDAGELAMRQAEAVFYTSTPDEIRVWINDFN